MTRGSAAVHLRALHDLVRRLPRDVEPPPELWQRIAARLDDPEPARSIEELARNLSAEIAPPADLWPEIAARLRTEPYEPRRRARLAAAAAVLAAVAGLVTVAVRVQGPGASDGGARSTLAIDPASTGAATSTALGAASLLRSPVVSEQVAATLQRELSLVHDERLRIEAAIDREPANVGLRELWAHAYQIELELTDTWGRIIMAYEG